MSPNENLATALVTAIREVFRGGDLYLRHCVARMFAVDWMRLRHVGAFAANYAKGGIAAYPASKPLARRRSF